MSLGNRAPGRRPAVQIREANQAYWSSEAEVEARLAGRMTGAWQQVLAEAERRRLTLRTAATCLAVRRVAEAHRQRGLYP